MADVARTRAVYTRPAFKPADDDDAALLSSEDGSPPPTDEPTPAVPPPPTVERVPRFVTPFPPERRSWSFVPVVGAVAVAGRQREMEDAVTAWTCLCSPLVNRFLPVHYFGVYDGHGGSHFSTLCKQKMHEILKEELTGVVAGVGLGPGPSQIRRPTPPPTDESSLKETWRMLLNRVFARTEMVALHTCSCGSVGFRCSCDRSALTYSGTTAVTVILTEKHYVVGNCGDSRAVLYRGGRIVPLSVDHKV